MTRPQTPPVLPPPPQQQQEEEEHSDDDEADSQPQPVRAVRAMRGTTLQTKNVGTNESGRVFKKARANYKVCARLSIRAMIVIWVQGIADGKLTKSRATRVVASLLAKPKEDHDDVINYGLNRVRFPAPLPAGSRVRGHFVLRAWEALPGGAQLTVEASMEREGSAKPVCVAESISRRFVATPPA